MSPLTHTEVEERGLLALYFRAALSAEEEERFEEHLLDCPACQEELAHQRRFESGLRVMAAEDAARPKPARILPFPMRRRTLLALAAGLAALLTLPLWWLASSRSRLVGELALLREEVGEQEQAVARLEAQLTASAEAQAATRRALEERLQRAEAAPAARLLESSVLLLAHLRSAPGDAAATLDLTTANELILLAADAGNDPRFTSYRATLEDGRGKRLVERTNLQPNALEVILLSFPKTFFAAGEYRLRLEGVLADGRTEPIDEFRVRVVGG